MSTLAMKHFDLLDFVNKSTELGMSKPLAEYQGRQLKEVVEIAIESSKEVLEGKNLATQKDIREIEFKIKELELKIQQVEARLEVKIEQSKNQLIMWMGALLVASGFITHFFK